MATVNELSKPLGLLAELTHRCPLGCPYCSNPLALEGRDTELDLATWARVFREAAALGVLQVHLSGGEPGSRRDLVEITAAARDAGLYSNLITSAVGIDGARLQKLADAGLDHVQISIQDSERVSADHIAGYEGAFARKRDLAAETVRMGLPLTINMVVAPRQHRSNRGDDRPRGGNGSEPHRNRACAILRLGAEEPAGLDADRRAGRARCRRGRSVAAKSGGDDRDRCGHTGLPRTLSEALRRRVGPAFAQCHAVGARIAVPRGRDHSRPRVLVGARPCACGDLVGIYRHSKRFAARTGCASHAKVARGGTSISVAAAAKPLH